MTRYLSDDLRDPGIADAELDLIAAVSVAAMDDAEACSWDDDLGYCRICYPDGAPEQEADDGAAARE